MSGSILHCDGNGVVGRALFASPQFLKLWKQFEERLLELVSVLCRSKFYLCDQSQKPLGVQVRSCFLKLIQAPFQLVGNDVDPETGVTVLGCSTERQHGIYHRIIPPSAAQDTLGHNVAAGKLQLR